MYYVATKKISYFMILVGILLAAIGLWESAPRSYSSETPDSVFMLSIAKRVAFPSLGLMLNVLGFIFLKLIREIQTENETIRNELSNLTKQIGEIRRK